MNDEKIFRRHHWHGDKLINDPGEMFFMLCLLMSGVAVTGDQLVNG
jgi:hypothetical protein